MAPAARALGALLLVGTLAAGVVLADDEDGGVGPGTAEGTGSHADVEAAAPDVAIAPSSAEVAVLLALPAPVAGAPGTWRGTVAHVTDGDTFRAVVTDPGDTDLRVGDEVPVRLLRVDTPEESRDGRDAECFAHEATAALARLLPVGSPVLLARDVEAVDRYQRQLAHAFTADGTWVNGHLLAAGVARVATFRPNVAHDDRVVALEEAARRAGAGLWSAC